MAGLSKPEDANAKANKKKNKVLAEDAADHAHHADGGCLEGQKG